MNFGCLEHHMARQGTQSIGCYGFHHNPEAAGHQIGRQGIESAGPERQVDTRSVVAGVERHFAAHSQWRLHCSGRRQTVGLCYGRLPSCDCYLRPSCAASTPSESP